MSAFFLSFAEYLVKMVILVALGICGGFIGVKLRIRSDKKKGVSEEVSDSANEE